MTPVGFFLLVLCIVLIMMKIVIVVLCGARCYKTRRKNTYENPENTWILLDVDDDGRRVVYDYENSSDLEMVELNDAKNKMD